MPLGTPFAPFARVNSPAMTGHELVTGLTLSLAEARHAVGVLTVLIPVATDRQVLDATVPSYLVWPDRSPVSLTYGSSRADSYDWYGYISSHQVMSGAGATTIGQFPTIPVQYTLTGATMVMQSAKTQAFAAQSASSIARQIAAGDRFDLATQPHPRVLPASVQAGQSDFAYLNALAAQVGWRCWPDNGLLYFLDPAVALTAASSAPTMVKNSQPGLYDTLMSFTSTVGETDPSGAILATQTAYAMRTGSGHLAQATTTPTRIVAGQSVAPQFTQIISAPVNSYKEAAYNTSAAAANARYWVSAAATCDGNTNLRPGRLLNAAGAGLKSADQGLWRICSAEHQINLSPLLAAHNTYTVNLTLGRDQENTLTLINPRTALPAPGAMTLVNGTWVAS